MKRLVATIAALSFIAAPALAADLPTRKGPAVLPPPPPPPPMWTGFYVGLNAGGTWSNSNSVATVGAPGYSGEFFGSAAVASALVAASNSYVNGSGNGGFIGGGQIGYNYQFYSSLVAGVEADIQGIAGSSNRQNFVTTVPVGDFPETYTAVTSARQNVNYIGTVRGRIGWLVTPTLLVFGTGGFAYGGVNLNTAFWAQESLGPDVYPAVFNGVNYSSTRTGWTAGGGVEWMFMPNWSAKAEYLYYDLGSVRANGAVAQFNGSELWGSAFTQTSARFNGNIVRAGVNYHFNWGSSAPIVAKY